MASPKIQSLDHFYYLYFTNILRSVCWVCLYRWHNYSHIKMNQIENSLQYNSDSVQSSFVNKKESFVLSA